MCILVPALFFFQFRSTCCSHLNTWVPGKLLFRDISSSMAQSMTHANGVVFSLPRASTWFIFENIAVKESARWLSVSTIERVSPCLQLVVIFCKNKSSLKISQWWSTASIRPATDFWLCKCNVNITSYWVLRTHRWNLTRKNWLCKVAQCCSGWNISQHCSADGGILAC